MSFILTRSHNTHISTARLDKVVGVLDGRKRAADIVLELYKTCRVSAAKFDQPLNTNAYLCSQIIVAALELHRQGPRRVLLVPAVVHVPHDVIHPFPVRRRKRHEPLDLGVFELECVELYLHEVPRRMSENLKPKHAPVSYVNEEIGGTVSLLRDDRIRRPCIRVSMLYQGEWRWVAHRTARTESSACLSAAGVDTVERTHPVADGFVSEEQTTRGMPMTCLAENIQWEP